MSNRSFVLASIAGIFAVLGFLLFLSWLAFPVCGAGVRWCSHRRTTTVGWDFIWAAALGIWLGGFLMWMMVGTMFHLKDMSPWLFTLLLSAVSPALWIIGAALVDLAYLFRRRSNTEQKPPSGPDQLGSQPPRDRRRRVQLPWSKFQTEV